MNNDKRIWFLEQYTQRAWTVALTLMQEAARAGNHGKGYAVVAHETSVLADKLFEHVASARFDGESEKMSSVAIEFSLELEFLSLNALLEAVHMCDISMESNIPKCVTVFSDQLRRIAMQIKELEGTGKKQSPSIITELASPSESASVSCFLSYSIGGYPLIENVSAVQEVLYRSRDAVQGKSLPLRGLSLPIINCYKNLNLSPVGFDEKHQPVIIINPNGIKYGSNEGLYAVPIDDLDMNAFFYSRNGRDVSPKDEHAFADYSRECWDVVGDDQLVFVDWKRLISD